MLTSAFQITPPPCVSNHYHFGDTLTHGGGGQIAPPLSKARKNDWNLVNRDDFAKIDYCCLLFMHLELNHNHFWPQKGPKNKCIFRRIRLYVKKIVDVKFFGNFKKKSQKWTTRELFNIARNKVTKNQPIQGIPRGLLYDIQLRVIV